MIEQKLEYGWKLKRQGETKEYEASVPGSVYQVYLEQGLMEDPYWRDNEDKALKLMEFDYVYSLDFQVDEALFDGDQIKLCMEGVDTLSDIWLNQIHLGNTNNMHRIWEYDISRYLFKEENNHLQVILHSPTNYIEEAYRKCLCDGSPECMEGFVHLRKSHCMFGWDWGPRLPDMGIWRPVKLYKVDSAKIDHILITQIHELDRVILGIDAHFQVENIEKKLCYDVKVTPPGKPAYIVRESPSTIEIREPMLWWPNGYGEQNIYEVEVILKADEKIVDMWKRKIGLRKMTVDRSLDEYGQRFAHEVNGIGIFAMGADYIPEDCILSRVSKERTRNLLMECKESNFNVIRVWGGGYYPDDYFYDICDELGLIVWQDFMFACGVYDLNEGFETNIRQEIIDNVKRIRHHACLGLWCGNNEMEMFISQDQWIQREKQKKDYLVINEYIIPQLLKEYDPNTFYWPSSPSSGGSFDSPNDENRGDVHYWDVWHGGVPFSEFRKFYFRYLSEFGFQSFPAIQTIESFTLPSDRNVFSYVMEKHQKNDAANGKILNYLSQTFLYPSSFELLIYASQLLQAEAIRYGVEHFRRNRGRCMGTVYWQLNDCWPVASWSSIDYYGRWKALHYYAKRFFAPLLLSCEEEGALTQNTNINAQKQEILKSGRLCVSNETRLEQKAEITWALRNPDSSIVRAGEYKVTIEALSSKWLPKLEFPEADIRRNYVSYELWQDGRIVSEGISLFGLPKHYEFLDPKLEIELIEDRIIIKSQNFAKGVEISNEKGDLSLSDNYFDMNAGEKCVIMRKGTFDDLIVRSIYNIH